MDQAPIDELRRIERDAEAAGEEIASIAEEARKLASQLSGEPGEFERAQLDVEELTARMARQLEEFIPAPPVDQLYERTGTAPAGAEQFARFVEGAKIPADSQ
ncbi:MAG: hypothetical protein ACR2K6_02915 [Solirubrobacterales bacterium]